MLQVSPFIPNEENGRESFKGRGELDEEVGATGYYFNVRVLFQATATLFCNSLQRSHHADRAVKNSSIKMILQDLTQQRGKSRNE